MTQVSFDLFEMFDLFVIYNKPNKTNEKLSCGWQPSGDY